MNQTLTLHFSEPLDPTSVTRASLSIQDEDGAPARGTVRVDGERVQFVPDPPLAPDLSDGGFRCGTRYRVEARGFPHLDGLRSIDGRPMRSTYRWSFVTVPDSDDPAELFFERERGSVEPLWLVGSVLLGDDWWLRMRAGEVLSLQSGRPILPSSVRPEDFELERTGGEPVPLEARLVENHDAGAAVPLGTARIELLPHRELAPGSYQLALPTPDSGPRDLAGGLLPRPTRPVRIEVFAYGEEHGVHAEDFLHAERQSPQAVPGFDGTASWEGDGVVTVRYPRAAGDGRDGHVQLASPGFAQRRDVQALSIVLGAGEVARLEAPGLVVLRAQRHLALQGELVRGGEAPATHPSWKVGERLSDWLARALEQDAPWTVLIAGGDLVIDGLLETPGPLLLVAGGAIRVSGEVRAQDRQLWLLGRGGGQGLDRTRSTPPLTLDAPRENPLLEPLTCAVLSEPLPAVGEVGRWLAPRAVGRDGGGTWRVRYVPAELPPGAAWVDVAEDAPWQVEPLGRLRLLIELTLHPRAQERPGWSPPFVDAVELHWERERSD